MMTTGGSAFMHGAGANAWKGTPPCRASSATSSSVVGWRKGIVPIVHGSSLSHVYLVLCGLVCFIVGIVEYS